MTWRLAIRVARREAWRNRGRSLLVASMIALPVAGASAADTLWRSTQVSAAEQAVREMGRYDAVVDAPRNAPTSQSPGGATPTMVTTPDSPPSRAGDTAGGPDSSPGALAALLPAGSRVTPYSPYGDTAAVTKGAGRVWSHVMGRDLTDPLQDGMTRRRSGTAPTKDDEAAVTTAELAALGKHVGDSIEVRAQGSEAKPKTLRITGVYDLPDALDSLTVFARPGVFTAASTDAGLSAGDVFYGGGDRGTKFLISVPGGVSWDLTAQLTAHGYTVKSRLSVEHPPPPAYANGSRPELVLAAIAVAMVLLEVILLAGPAFAVGARRRRRDFGLLGAAGADAARLRRIVLADGLVLGAAGGVVGIAVGVLGSAAGYPWLSDLGSQEPGGFQTRPAELLAAGLVGALTGLIAALAPAIATGRQDVLHALTGRRGETRTPWKLPAVGLGGVGVGTLLVFYGAFRPGFTTVPVIAGIAVAELGVVACTPLLVSWSGRAARFLPLSGRLALRDGARNRGRTAPAVAAIMAAVAGASAIAVIISTADAKARAQYTSAYRAGEAEIDLGGLGRFGDDGGVDVTKVAGAVGALLPTKQAAIQYGPIFTGQKTVFPEIRRTDANKCPYPPGLAEDEAGKTADQRCRSGPLAWFGSVTAGGPELLRVLTGTENAEAEDVLRHGGAVVFNPLDLTTPAPHATVTIGSHSGNVTPGADSGPTITLPAAVVPEPSQGGQAVVAVGSLDKLGVKMTPLNLLIDTTRVPTAGEQDKADAEAAALGVQSQLYVERGYQGGTMLGLLALAAVAGIVTLGAAAVATGLAIADAQNDLETLAAVGARPRVRRVLAGSLAAVTAGLGALLGAAFGLLPAIGLIEAQTHGLAEQLSRDVGRPFQAENSYLTIPWLFLGLVILVLPMLAAVGASGVTRSRIELRRRRA